ncbi:MAG: peptidase lon domain protein [Pseudonocardia sp.]|nr:peptidase lon domain protein [Pseudonocardia sp.]
MLTTVPLFPLSTVLMPGATLPLHIFEPRYRQLTIDLVTGAVPDRQFGVIALREGFMPDRDGIDGLHNVGCTALLREAQRLPDGRFDIVTKGARRFHLHELHVDAAPYLVGTVEWLPDAATEPDNDQQVRFLSAAARAAHRKYCTTAWREGWQEPSRELEPATLPHVLAGDCLLSITDRQRLLEQRCPTQRLRMIRKLLATEAALLSELRAVPAPVASYAVEHSCN